MELNDFPNTLSLENSIFEWWCEITEVQLCQKSSVPKNPAVSCSISTIFTNFLPFSIVIPPTGTPYQQLPTMFLIAFSNLHKNLSEFSFLIFKKTINNLMLICPLISHRMRIILYNYISIQYYGEITVRIKCGSLNVPNHSSVGSTCPQKSPTQSKLNR